MQAKEMATNGQPTELKKISDRMMAFYVNGKLAGIYCSLDEITTGTMTLLSGAMIESIGRNDLISEDELRIRNEITGREIDADEK